jgi:hypothetical protein
MNSEEEIYRMCSILKGCLEVNQDLLDYWRKRCNYPNMTSVAEIMYAFNATTYEIEISRLEESLELWNSRKNKLDENLI